MKLHDLATKVHVPTCDVTITTEDKKTEILAVPRLSIGDWKAIKAQSIKDKLEAQQSGKAVEGGKVVDMWAMLLDISNQVDEKALKGKTDEQKEEIRRQAGMKLFKDLDHNIQLMMFHRALRHIDPEVTEKEADDLISYGIEDQGEYMKALMFLIYGVKVEETEAEAPLEIEAARPATHLGDVPLTGGGSISSSPDGIRGKR